MSRWKRHLAHFNISLSARIRKTKRLSSAKMWGERIPRGILAGKDPCRSENRGRADQSAIVKGGLTSSALGPTPDRHPMPRCLAARRWPPHSAVAGSLQLSLVSRLRASEGLMPRWSRPRAMPRRQFRSSHTILGFLSKFIMSSCVILGEGKEAEKKIGNCILPSG